MLTITRTLIVVGVFAMVPVAHAGAQSKPKPAARPQPVAMGPQAETARAVPRQQQDAPSQEAGFVPDLNNVSPAAGQNGVHPAVGSWFGKAVQVVPPGVAPSAAAAGLPAGVLFMTPTFHGDGTFVANDSFALQSPPFGPHTTAHGEWIATSANQVVADIVFLLNPFPPPEKPTTGAVHIKYAATVTDANTMVGYVNIYFRPALRLSWQQLGTNEYPTLPDAAFKILAVPDQVFRDPTVCGLNTDECPLVFKFTIKRVATK